MHATDPKNAFLVMRANGWSLGSISRQLGVPKSTLFNWESDAPTRHTINVLKSLQLERLQEKYLPSFEEELQKLSTCLCRIERALDKHDFEAMRPEFLLRTSLQLRSRLNKLRSDIQPTRTLDHGELPPNPLPGCISRSRTEIADTYDDADSAPSPLNGERAGVRGETVPCVSTSSKVNGEGQGEVSEILHPKWDENKNSSRPEPSTPATSNDKNGTIVPNSTPARPSSSSSNSEPLSPSHAHERYGELATPLANIPVHADADQIALTAGLGASRSPASARPCPPLRPITPPPHKPCTTNGAQPSAPAQSRSAV